MNVEGARKKAAYAAVVFALILLLVVNLPACSTEGQSQAGGVTTGQASRTTGQPGPPAQVKTVPLDVCTTMGTIACQLMSKIYPEQAPTCSAYREANGRLVETCGYPTSPANSPSAPTHP